MIAWTDIWRPAGTPSHRPPQQEGQPSSWRGNSAGLAPWAHPPPAEKPDLRLLESPLPSGGRARGVLGGGAVDLFELPALLGGDAEEGALALGQQGTALVTQLGARLNEAVALVSDAGADPQAPVQGH